MFDAVSPKVASREFLPKNQGAAPQDHLTTAQDPSIGVVEGEGAVHHIILAYAQDPSEAGCKLVVPSEKECKWIAPHPSTDAETMWTVLPYTVELLLKDTPELKTPP